MSDGSKIEWTEATWSWVTGCTKISDGCLNCYIQTTPPSAWPDDLRVREFPVAAEAVPA